MGVISRSPFEGSDHLFPAERSIEIQRALGADIIFAFDECLSPEAPGDYQRLALDRTHTWSKRSLDCHQEISRAALKRVPQGQPLISQGLEQALFGIVQGGRGRELREESARVIGAMNFDGFGIGGDLWRERSGTKKILRYVIPNLNERKPRHLLGVGHLKNIEDIIKEGIDLFDCTVPTHYARHGITFTTEGKLDLNKSKFLKKNEPLDKGCVCKVCLNYKKDYISHLLKAKEITALKLITFHNLWYFNNFIEDMRQKIKKGEI